MFENMLCFIFMSIYTEILVLNKYYILSGEWRGSFCVAII